ncbi:MAG: hypothetical protein AAB474_02655 [Patescibacteria group bacterium]
MVKKERLQFFASLLTLLMALLYITAPSLVFAQTFQKLLSDINVAIKSIVPVLIAITGAVFLWGVFIFVTGADSEEKRKKGINIMIYSLIGIVLAVSVWGLVNLVIKAFGIDNPKKLDIPQIKI